MSTLEKDIDKLSHQAEYYDSNDTSALMEKGQLVREPGPELMIVTSVRLPKPVMDALREAAAARSMGVTQLIREWIEERLARESTEDVMVPVEAILAVLAERGVHVKRAS